MSCKLAKTLILLCACGIAIQTTEAIIFTIGGFLLDSALAFEIFGHWLHAPLLLGKRSVDSPVLSFGQAATAEEYLSVATSIDTNRCLPLAVCAALARSKDTTAKLSEFDSSVAQTFSGKLDDNPATGDVKQIDFYIESAKFGYKVGNADQCRLISPKCDYSLEELKNLTLAISQYNTNFN
ncbi:hypothetical protein CHUAL_002284 [Chamberlinius hualienensis]